MTARLLLMPLVALALGCLLAFMPIPQQRASGDFITPPLVNWAHPLNKRVQQWWLYYPGWSGGGTTWRNLRGTGHGTLTNMAFPSTATSGWGRQTTRRGGFGELRCDGTDDFVTTTATFPLARGTIATWIYPTATTTNTRPWVDVGGGYVYPEFTGASTMIWSVWDTSGFLSVPSFTITANTWQRLVMTWTGAPAGLFTVYVNGRQVAQATGTGGINASATFPLQICGEPGQSFTGVVDDLKIWDVALPAALVRDDYLESQAGYPTALLHPDTSGYLAAAAATAPRKRLIGPY